MSAWSPGWDDHGFEGEISEKPGILKTEPSGVFQKSYKIRVYRPETNYVTMDKRKE